MRGLKILLTLVLILVCFQQIVFATGPSYLKIKILPVTYNDKGEILFKTRYEVNPTGAHRYMKTEYGWLVVSAEGIWEESLHKICEPDLNDNKLYEACEKEFKKKFNWNAPPKSVLTIIKKYNFKKKDIHSKKNKSISSITIGNINNIEINTSGYKQKSIHGIMEEEIVEASDSKNNSAPLFNYAGVFVFNNYSDEEDTIGAEFDFPHLFNENILTDNEFIETYDIDAICIIKEK